MAFLDEPSMGNILEMNDDCLEDKKKNY